MSRNNIISFILLTIMVSDSDIYCLAQESHCCQYSAVSWFIIIIVIITITFSIIKVG